MTDVVIRLRELMEDEALSRSMDFGCVTRLYAHHLLDDQFSMAEIEKGLKDIRKSDFFEN